MPARSEGVAAYHAELARAFAKRRCTCGARATVITVGIAPVREMGITLTRGVKERNLCLRCAGMGKVERKRNNV